MVEIRGNGTLDFLLPAPLGLSDSSSIMSTVALAIVFFGAYFCHITKVKYNDVLVTSLASK